MLSIVTKITLETRATGESTYELFCRAYREIEKKEPHCELTLAQVKAYHQHGHAPPYVVDFFKPPTPPGPLLIRSISA